MANFFSGSGGSIGGLVGGIIGSYFGPVGFAIGAAIGGYIGGSLDPGPGQTTIGPRLNDLRQQTGGYGEMLPLVFGNIRVAGTVIYLPPKILETGQYIDTDGNSFLQFNYSTSPAIALCDAEDGPIVGIGKVWEDGKLVANYSSITPQHPLTLPGASYVNVYTGSETQAADAYLSGVPDVFAGARNDSAYRGTAYVFIRNRQLATTFSRLGNLEFEVISKAAIAESIHYIDTPSQLALLANGNIAPDGNLLVVNYTGGTTPRVNTFALRDKTTLAVITTFTPGTLPFGDHVDANATAPVMNPGGDILFFGVANAVYIWPFGGTPVQVGGFASHSRGWWNQVDGNFYVGMVNVANTANVLARIAPGATTYTTLRSSTGAGITDLYDGNDGYLYMATAGSPAKIEKIRRTDGALIASFNTVATSITSLCTAGDGSVWFLWGSTPQLRRIAPDFLSDALIFNSGGAYASSIYEKISQDWATGDVISTMGNHTTGGQYRYHADGTPAGSSALFGSVINSTTIVSSPSFPEIYAFNQYGATTQFVALITTAVTNTDTTLDEVVTRICGRVGLTPADLDVTQLAADVVNGYAITQRDSARGMLAPLMTAYFFDCVESGNKLKFVKRGGASVATILQADMGAQASGSQPGQPYSVTRMQETELPREITLSFYDIDRDYQISTVYARRQVVQSVNDVTMNLALVFTATEAQRIVNAMLYEAWASRTTITFSLSQKYARLEPTDVVDLALDEGTFTVRILSKAESGGIIQFQAAFIDGALYVQPADGFSGPAGQTDVGDSAPTALALLDTALLNPADDTYGFYGEAGGSGTGVGWPGSELLKSTDGGTTYLHTAYGFSVPATIGTAISALPDFSGGNVFDRNSTVDVSINSGTIGGITDLAVLNGGNLAWFSTGEIIQFASPNTLSPGIFRLSNLLRGRFGTEWAMRRHVAGEVFSIIDPAAYKSITAVAGDIGVPVKYKGVTFNTSEALAASQDFTLASNRLKPLSPVQIGGGRNAAGDITINWKRRARKAADWIPGAVLDEPTESYEIDVFAGTALTITAITAANPAVFSTSGVHGLSPGSFIYIRAIVGPVSFNDRAYVVISTPTTSTFTVGEASTTAWISGGSVYLRGRTLTASTTTVSYSAANQTTDYTGTQATVYVAAYQISSRVGRGYAGTGAV